MSALAPAFAGVTSPRRTTGLVGLPLQDNSLCLCGLFLNPRRERLLAVNAYLRKNIALDWGAFREVRSSNGQSGLFHLYGDGFGSNTGFLEAHAETFSGSWALCGDLSRDPGHSEEQDCRLISEDDLPR